MLFYVDIETEHKLAILDLNTVEPPVSDHPCKMRRFCGVATHGLPHGPPIWTLLLKFGD